MAQRDDIVGVALAGGQSKRMGRDKTLLTWPPGAKDVKPLWCHAVDRLREVAEDVVLADAGRCLAPSSSAPSPSRTQSVPDGVGKGPVAGILGAADVRPGRPLLVLAADLPLVPVELLRYLVDAASEEEAAWVVPSRQRGLEPLCSVFGPLAVDALRRRAEAGTFDLHGLAAETELRIRRVGDEEARRFGEPDEIFVNVNRAEDWDRARVIRGL